MSKLLKHCCLLQNVKILPYSTRIQHKYTPCTCLYVWNVLDGHLPSYPADSLVRFPNSGNLIADSPTSMKTQIHLSPTILMLGGFLQTKGCGEKPVPTGGLDRTVCFTLVQPPNTAACENGSVVGDYWSPHWGCSWTQRWCKRGG